MRLFVAIDLSDEVRRAVAAEQKRIARILAPGDTSLKWVRPEHLHLTLAFIGNVEEPDAAPIVDAMAQPIGTDSFGVAFGGPGVFPPRGAPRVLWLGLAAGAAEVIEIQRVVVNRLGAAHAALDRRLFHPHLTLARWRSSRVAVARQAMAADRGATTPRMAVDAATLYRSRLTPTGPTYTPLARARFAGAEGHRLQ